MIEAALVTGAAVSGRPGHALDGMTGGGVLSMTRTWALEFARHGITVNAVAPGRIDAGGEAAPGPDDGDPELRAIPTGRAGRAEEVAPVVAFFLDAHTTFITGQLLFVCGGLSTGGPSAG